MRKVICAPANLLPKTLDPTVLHFSTYSNPHRKSVGYFGPSLQKDLMRKGLTPSVEAWDFTTVALSVAAADNSVSRRLSPDGWTREIELNIHVCDPTAWSAIKDDFQNTLRFLTGDFWFLNFLEGGTPPTVATKTICYNSDCVSLLSGGVDSLVGAIDLFSQKRNPILVSQTVHGDADSQIYFAKQVKTDSSHFQWSHKLHRPTEESEGSTRGRSIIFFAFAALAACAIETPQNKPTDIYVPENGFISLNTPLNPGRMGSFSTKTTHPIYLSGIRRVWDALGLNLNLVTPYQFLTKGDLLLKVKNEDTFTKLLDRSTSCGKYARHGHQHCGRCIPCMVRRAAYIKAGIPDNTIGGYKYKNLTYAGRERGANDVGAMAKACLTVQEHGVQRLIGAGLSFATNGERQHYENLITRGFEELSALLTPYNLI